MCYTKKKQLMNTAAARKEVVSFSTAIDMDVSKLRMFQNSGYQDYEWSVVLSRGCLKIYGVWPENGENEREKWASNVRVILLLIVMSFSTAIPTLHSLVRIWGSVVPMVDNLQLSLPLMIAMLKMFLLWWKKKELLPMMKMIKEDWLRLKTKEERRVMMRRARTVRIVTICAYLMMLILFVLIAIVPAFGISLRYVTNITDPGKLLPMQTYYVYDINRSPFYEITFILQGITVISTGVMYTSTHTFLGLLVFHICGQLENLKARILHIDASDFENNLSHIVQDHKRLIRSVKSIDDIFNVMTLGLLIYFGFLFALYGFLFVTTTQGSDLSIGRFMFTISAFVYTFTHMCIYCVVGEILVIQGEGIYEAVCEYKWYKLEPRKAINLLMIMNRANKPLYLTAGKLFPMTMSTFCNLLKTSGGYISVLLAHRE